MDLLAFIIWMIYLLAPTFIEYSEISIIKIINPKSNSLNSYSDSLALLFNNASLKEDNSHNKLLVAS